MSNTHITRTQELLEAAKDAPLLERESITNQAIAEATLALVYEQQTANLIHVFAQLGDDNPTYLGLSTKGNELAKTILERLTRKV